MVEKFNPSPIDKHREDPKEAAKGRPRDGRKFYGWVGLNVFRVRPRQRHTAGDANGLAKSIADLLMGRNAPCSTTPCQWGKSRWALGSF